MWCSQTSNLLSGGSVDAQVSPAAQAKNRIAMFEWRGPVILGRDHNLTVSIGESIPSVDEDANESVRELFGPIVGNRDVLYDDAAFSIDVHKQVPE